MNSEIARRWLAATLFVYIVGASLEVVGSGARKALDIDDAEAALSVKAAYFAFEVVSSVIYFALYAQMTGPVLRLIVPALQQKTWLKVHLAAGLIFAIGAGLLLLQSDGGEPGDLSDTSLRVANAVGVVIVGGVQANVLRRAAHGAGAWIATVGIAVVVTTLITIAIDPALPKEKTLAAELKNGGIAVLLSFIGATIMLPALWRLRPRTI